MDMSYLILIGFFSILGMLVGGQLKRKMKLYAQTPISNQLSGFEIAKKMLYDNDIYDVEIVEGRGFLTDHFNPKTKTVSLSPEIYRGRSVAAAAVAAHECGHAVQYATGYRWLEMRSSMVPVVSLGSRFYFWIIFAGLFTGILGIAWLGVALFAVTTVFSIVTLPVEYDASNRAIAWLQSTNTLQQSETIKAKDALKWAARTYVVAAIASLGQLVYWVARIND